MGRITKKLTPEERKRKQEQQIQKRTTTSESGEVVVMEKPKSALPAKPPAPAVKVNKEPNFFQRAAQFIRETKLEFKRVTWPTRQQTITTTAVVIILVIIVAIILGVMDTVLSLIVKGVLSS